MDSFKMAFLKFSLASLALSSVVNAATLFNGAQSTIFPSTTSTTCLAAFNTTLTCDPIFVQYLPRMEQYAQWNKTTKDILCTSACDTSLQNLQAVVDADCSGQKFKWTSGNMTFSQVVEMYYYKFEIICLKDEVTGSYCSDVEATWNITAMENAGTATWPTNTLKYYRDPNNDWFVNINDDSSTNLFNVRNATDPSTIDGGLNPAIEDYYYDRKGPDDYDDSNYGWPAALEYDEYPLEIQCHNCFLNRFILGIESQFGVPYDEIATQYWSNWKLNCPEINSIIAPARNITGAVRYSNHTLPSNLPPVCYNLTLAAYNTTTTCDSFALKNGVPLRGLVALNTFSGSPNFNCYGLSNGTYCGPPTCPLGRVTQPTDATSYVAKFSNFTLPQFLSWNPFLTTSLLMENETVCVGPQGAAYTPSLASSVLASTVFLSTTTPAAPTSVGTFKSCGEYHVFASGELCVQIALNYTLTFLQFLTMNPLVNADCTNMVIGNDYCVAAVNGTTIATPTAISAPAATASGALARCFSWHIVTATDTCDLITPAYGLTSAEFLFFNPSINSACSNLIVGDAYCIDATGVHSAGNATTVTAPAATTTGTIKPCYQWHTAVTGDTCASIELQYGISAAMLALWNQVLVNGASCSAAIVVGDAFCVDGTGKMATVTSILAPAQTVTGTTNPCYRWHIVASADTCSLLVDEYGVNVTAIEAWNPSLGTSCKLPAAGDAICVDGAGRPSNTTTVAAPATTLQGTVLTCYLWHVVVSGDTCTTIETKYNLYFALLQAWNPTLNSLCTNLQANVAYCVQGTPTVRVSGSPTSGSCTGTPAGIALASPTPSGAVCNVQADSIAQTGTGLLTAYTSGSPYVTSVQACAAECIATSTCTNIYFVAGASCNLHYGVTAYTINTSGANAYSLYDISCFTGIALASPTPSGAVCNVQADSIAQTGTGLLTAYTSGSPYVTSVQACAAECIATPTCTNIYFVEGASCNLHYGVNAYVINTSGANAYSFYDVSCFATCSINQPTSTGGNGISTPTPIQTSMATNCDKFHLVVSGDQCGTIATNSGVSLADFYKWNPAVGSSCQFLDLGDYVCIGLIPTSCTSASVLPAPTEYTSTCGAYGFSNDTPTSLLLVSYTAGSPYVASAGACGAQCLANPACTNLYFIQGNSCNLHEEASTFSPSTAAGTHLWYEAMCFSSGEACGSFGFSHDTNDESGLIISYTSGSAYVASAAACGAECLSTTSCTNVYFNEGNYCNLHFGEYTFQSSTAAGYYSWYQYDCFVC